MTIGKHGITQNTPRNILLGAGTFHKNLQFVTNAWQGDILGATSGGGKISIIGEFLDIELDGALVKVKGLTVKNGGAAAMEVNFAELTADTIKHTTLFKEGTSSATGYTMLVDKPNIEAGDYIDNLGFVGKTTDGRNIVVIFESALCKTGLELEPKNKENAVFKGTFEAYAENSGDLDTLPVKIYYPGTAAA